MIATSSKSLASGLRALLLAASVTLGIGCTPANPHGAPGASNIYSPPGAVASALIEPGEPKPLRTYGPENKTWPEIRTSPGHAAHRGSDNVLCRDCHAKDGFKHEGNGGCTRSGCHELEAKHPHGAVDRPVGSGCIDCHSFHPGTPQKACIDCHKDVQTQQSGAKLAAIVDGHSTAVCAKCHQSHKEPIAKAADCISCHKQRAPGHAVHKGSRGCSDCHATHTLSKAATKTCTSSGCHTKPAGPKPANHASCLTCHAKHETEKPLDCAGAGCHNKVVTLASKKIGAHAKCTSCHVAHSPRDTAAACQKCHAKITVAHAKEESAKGTPKTKALYATKGATSVNACSACHEVHPKDPAQKPASCTSCHTMVAKADKGAHAANLACATCHPTHALKAPAKTAALCSGCHAPQSKLVATNKGHADCTSCHGGPTHALTAPSTCASCHTAELASAPKGHAKCATCHETHGAKLLPKAECQSCHAERTKGPHKAIKGSCQTCHRAHGPKGVAKPPSCESCHPKDKLPGLHVKHLDCTRCHTAHASVNATRASCTNCHTKQATGHEPAAKVCTGCHVFMRP